MPTTMMKQQLSKDAIVVLVLCIIFGYLSISFGIVMFFTEDGSPDKSGAWVALITGVICLLAAIIILIVHSSKNKSIEATNEKNWRGYKNAQERIIQENATIQNQYNINYKAWSQSNVNALSYLQKPLTETENTLRKYYSADIVFPKYRNLPALTSIYEYLSSGRCEDLTGPVGAYNIYESEVRQNMVISQLSAIVSNLEKIRQNQYTLYEEFCKINRTTNRIASELSTIRSYTHTLTQLSALNTYYNSVTAENTAAIAFFQSLS